MATIPGSATEIRYRRTGQLAGRYVHRFRPGVRMRANADGSVTLRGRRRIHATDDEPGFWQRYGGRRRRRNPGLFSALARGARSGYHTYRASRYESKAERHRRKARGLMHNPRRRRRSQDNTLLWLALGIGLYAYATRSAGAAPVPSPAGGTYLPQPYSYWFNPSTGELFLAGGDGIPPGSVPPWRLASEAEIFTVVGP